MKPLKEPDLLRLNEKYIIKGEKVALSLPKSNIEDFDFTRALPVEGLAKLSQEEKSGLLYIRNQEKTVFFHLEDGENAVHYGLPEFQRPGIKIARHVTGGADEVAQALSSRVVPMMASLYMRNLLCR